MRRVELLLVLVCLWHAGCGAENEEGSAALNVRAPLSVGWDGAPAEITIALSGISAQVPANEAEVKAPFGVLNGKPATDGAHVRLGEGGGRVTYRCDREQEPRCAGIVWIEAALGNLTAKGALMLEDPAYAGRRPGMYPDTTGVVATLTGLRWDLPCTAHSGIYCSTPAVQFDAMALPGATGILYELNLRFRGVAELQQYDGGVARNYFLVGGTPVKNSTNVYSLKVSNPTETYYLNREPNHAPPASCVMLDYTESIWAYSGAKLTLAADSKDGTEIVNFGPDHQPIVIPDVAPFPNAFDGQFVQMDVVKARALSCAEEKSASCRR